MHWVSAGPKRSTCVSFVMESGLDPLDTDPLGTDPLGTVLGRVAPFLTYFAPLLNLKDQFGPF